MYSREEINLKDSVSLHIKVLEIVGLWHSKENSKSSYRYIYQIYSAFTTTVLMVYILQESISLILAFGKSEEEIEIRFYTTSIHYVGLLKIFLFFSKIEGIQELIDCLELPTFQPINKRQKKMIKSVVENCRVQYISYIILVFFALASFGMKEKAALGEELPMGVYNPYDVKKRYK